jgi:hypothetical protein
MVASINASTSAGVVTTADTSGVLALQTASTTALSISASQVVTLTNALPVASGGTGGTTSTGSGAVVLGTSPTITTPTISSLSSASATALTLQSAGTTAVTIDTSQNVLVGTTTSTNNIRLNQKIAVVTAGNGNYGGISNTAYNGTSAGIAAIYDLQRSRGTTDGSMTAVASGDTLGYSVYRGADGTGFIDSSYISGEVDGTVATNQVPGRLVFKTASSAGSMTERMRINSSGDVIIGTTGYGPTGSAKLRSYKTGNRPNIEAEQGDSGGYNYTSIAFVNGSTYYHCNFQEGATQRGSITSNGANTAYNTGSDYRLKDDVVPMTGALNKISALKPVAWKWKSNGSDGQGFLAHELQEIVPECVTGAKDAVDENGNPVYQMVDVSYLIATLTAAIQEAKALIDTQAETINALTARIVALEGA